MNRKKYEAFLPHIQRKLKAECVNKGDHKKALKVLGKCVLGNQMVKVYMKLNRIREY